MKRNVHLQIYRTSGKGTKIAQIILVAFCLLVSLSNATTAQDREPHFVTSKEGRRYLVESPESYQRRFEELRSQARTETQLKQTLVQADRPATYSLAQFQTIIKDQQDRGTCWAFAGAAALEAAYRRKYGLTLDLSEQYLFHMSKAMAYQPAVPDNNTSLTGFQGSSDIVSHLTKYAISEERFAPYLNGAQMDQLRIALGVGNIVTTPTQIGYDTFEFSEGHIPTAARWNAQYRITDYGRISNYTDESALEQVLTENREIVVDLNLRWKYNAGSNVYEFDPGSPGGGHVLLLIGYDRNQKLFIAKNSWGGSEYFRLTYDFVKNNIGGAYYIKDVSHPNEPPMNKARFLGFRDFDGITTINVRLQGRLIIRRFTNINGADPAELNLGTLYPGNGSAPLNVTGFFINNGNGIVLHIHYRSGTEWKYHTINSPAGFWRFVDRNYAGSTQLGTPDMPFRSFIDGATTVPGKGEVFVQPGSYFAVRVYSNPMTIKAPRGGVTLGNGN